jgi:hypothetical protein
MVWQAIQGSEDGRNNGQMVPKCCEGIQRTQSCFGGANMVSEAFLGVRTSDGWWDCRLVSPMHRQEVYRSLRCSGDLSAFSLSFHCFQIC